MQRALSLIFATAFSCASLLATDPANQWIEQYIETIPDFPKPDIQFKCYPALLQSPEAFQQVIATFAERYRSMEIDTIVGLESRGFLFGAALAYEMRLPFVMVRKAGKLPRKVERIDYELEYGTASFEVETASIQPGNRVLIIDDLMATGGTAAAASALIERLGGEVVEVACLIELDGLGGRARLQRPFYALVSVDEPS